MVYTTIKVKHGGCGVCYKDDNGVVRHALKTPEDGPFECEIEQAKHFVELGVAEFVADTKSDGKAQDGDKLVGHLDAEQLETMTNAELIKLAEDMGVDLTGCKKKAEYIAAIVAAEVEVDDADEGDDDELPDLNAADPE